MSDPRMSVLHFLLAFGLSLGLQGPVPGQEGTDDPPAEPESKPEEPAEGDAGQEPAPGKEAKQDEKQDAKQDEKQDEKQPEFKKDSGKEDFEKGKSLYAGGKYKEAESLFKKAKAEGKEKADKDIVDRWFQGAGGAQLVDKVRARVKQNQLIAAYQEAETYFRKYRGTPAEDAFRKLLEEIGSQIFVVLEDFNVRSPAFTEKYGKFFVNDPKVLLDGTMCLRWTSTKTREAATLQLKRIPSDWTPYETLEFWVKVTQAPADPEAVIFSGDGRGAAKKKAPAKKRKDLEDAPRLGTPLKLPTGGAWQRMRIPIGEFTALGDGTLSSVTMFQIQVGGGRQFDLLIDKIVLVKKNPGSAAPAGKRKVAGAKG